MEKLFLLLLFCHVSSPVKHSLKYFFTASSGVPNFPEFVGAAVIDEVLAADCDSNKKILEPKQDWVRKMFENNPQHWELYITECFEVQPNFFKARIDSLKQQFNQTGGVHILQRMIGCEWDDETGDVNGFNQYGYNGEDFISLDLKTSTWITPNQKAIFTKQRWDADKARIKHNEIYLTEIYPERLKTYLAFGNSSLLRTDLPSVSLLQKTPSSPVSCHATGFYPDRAMIFWRKDGEELHEDVDLGEILPNHDGSFQRSVDLKPPGSSEDWTKYECVFQLSGMKDVVTRLDKAVIRTNEGNTGIRSDEENLIYMIIIIVVAAVVLVAIGVIGFFIYKKKNDTKTECQRSDTSSTESLTSESETSTGNADSDTQLIKDRSE